MSICECGLDEGTTSFLIVLIPLTCDHTHNEPYCKVILMYLGGFNIKRVPEAIIFVPRSNLRTAVVRILTTILPKTSSKPGCS